MPPVLAAVVAHPDDESYAFGGTIARATARGARAWVIAATRGEGGWDLTGAGRRGEALARARSEELAASCRALGAEPPRFLGLRDGAVAEDEAVGAERLRAVLAALAPDAVLTLGPDGAYGHADHLATTRMVSAAASGRVLHACFPPGLFAPFFARMKAHAPEVLAVDDAAALGCTDAALEVDVSAFREAKLASIAAHHSQVPGGDPHRFLAPGLVDALLDVERYEHAAGPPLPAGATDPFEGP
ncbi:MAG TPA: PIG-L deacetylase family protein [Sandaracinaceae bacterium LLY-WYZ-13_1]|nr:PIG-L deacetylase family protein [Sandaracinaceae bacterium LLY-WYZ-13_1]